MLHLVEVLLVGHGGHASSVTWVLDFRAQGLEFETRLDLVEVLLVGDGVLARAEPRQPVAIPTSIPAKIRQRIIHINNDKE